MNPLSSTFLWLNSKGRIVSIHPGVGQTLGYPVPDLLDKPISKLIPPWTTAVWTEHWAKLMAGETVEVMVRRRPGRGKLRSVQVTLSPLILEQKTYGFVQLEDYGTSEREFSQFRQLVDNASDTLYSYRLGSDAGFEYLSPSIERLMGYPPHAYYQNRELLLSQVHPDDLPRFQGLLEGKTVTDSPLSLRWFHRNGHLVWTEQQDTFVYSPLGEAIAIEGVIRDITKRHEAELALRQQAERERLVSAIAQRIRQSLNLEEILQTTVSEVRHFLDSDRVLIYRFDANPAEVPNCHGIVVVESVDRLWKPMLNHQIPLSHQDSPELQRYLNGRSYLINDSSQETDPTIQALLNPFQIKSSLIVPILLQSSEGLDHGCLWGLLVAHQCRQERHWQSLEVELLQQLATQVAIAIQQSHLFEQVQQQGEVLEKEIRERTQQLQQAIEFDAMLKRITDKVRDSLDESQIVQTAVREVAVVLGVGSCNAALYDLDQGTSTICYEYTNFIPASQGRVSQMGNFPELYTQLMDGCYFQFCSLIPNPVRGRVAMLASPLFDNQGVLGDLWLVHHAEYEFTDLEIRLVQQVANQCAIAIRQARLYQAAQTQVAELEKLNRLKDDFLSAVSHELRTPIANMKLAIEMLKLFAPQEDDNPEPKMVDSAQVMRIQRYLNILNTECTREEELVEDLLDLQRLENNAYLISMSLINLNEWIPTLTRPFYTRVSDREQGLHVDCPKNLPPFVCDRLNLERILVELLNNACKYTATRGDIHLQVRQCEIPGEDNFQLREGIEFSIRNQASIPPEELPKIFDKFYRIPNADPWKQGGTGLGLALIEKLVFQLQGQIGVESAEGWTTFRVVFPNQRQELNFELNA
ncbi:GAF domain-containing protein [Phormidium yuhuli AB48]|uniref:histidine kinase n=1 Tax=Phormidium yuhuli AB48 TaxID=2940671 RepID=A0ABY5ARY7_9CYAN|nr:GAF domain-containing protein [Phormidium yuhuli]USR91984.1 GAF domain-containing protein [Phormidium yuhuli AB48]